jgi:hypothetical protein
MNRNLKYILYFLPFLVFFTIVINDRLFNRKKSLIIDDFLDIEVVNIRKYKNIIVLKDTISIFKNTERVFPKNSKQYYKNYYKFIKSVKPPFHLHKKKGSDTLLVIKNKDSFFYKLQPL